MGVVAALASEARTLGPSLQRAGTPALRELAWADGGLLAVSGMGEAAAAAAASHLVEAGVSALMTFGMAGGLDPALEAGAVVMPLELISAAGVALPVCRTWRERVAAAVGPLRTVSDGTLLCSGGAIGSPADKAAAFRSTGAAAVDMESAAVAQVAAAHSLPFIAVRVIVDTSADRLPRAVIAASRAGRLKFGRLIAGLAVAPGDIAALLRLARRYRIAMRSLRVIGAHLS
ncbi:MAG TPA: hypothetical protein VHW71_12685 [Steroidobacteraceae bacterium]|nr:hypothetical protein [Steroidobacteraceae bacterium]